LAQPPLEVEAALVVCAPAPLVVRERLAALAALPGFRLLPRPELSLGDTYVDTPDRALAAGGVALRVRTVDGADALLTYKAQVRRTAAGVERVEIEAPWSPAALDAVLAELARDGLRLTRPDPGELAGGEDPLPVLLGLGLEVVQARVNRRIPRDVVREGGPAGPVAELAVDAVAYHLPAGVARLHEVEVEAKGAGGADLATVERVMAALRQRFGDELAPWPHGKLVTGHAIQALLDAGRLDGLRDPDGTLRPAAYQRIAAHLAAHPDG
jgi:CYTH domain